MKRERWTHSYVSRVIIVKMGRRNIPPWQLLLHIKFSSMVVAAEPSQRETEPKTYRQVKVQTFTYFTYYLLYLNAGYHTPSDSNHHKNITVNQACKSSAVCFLVISKLKKKLKETNKTFSYVLMKHKQGGVRLQKRTYNI